MQAKALPFDRLLVFDSVHQAIRAEKLLLARQLNVELVPTPREISASCGQSIAFLSADIAAVATLLNGENLPYGGIYAADPAQHVYERLAGRGPETWNSI